MDPNVLLERIMARVNEILDRTDEDENDLALDIAELNAWLVSGGFLPDDWKRRV